MPIVIALLARTEVYSVRRGITIDLARSCIKYIILEGGGYKG
jgi:hypothetical protein